MRRPKAVLISLFAAAFVAACERAADVAADHRSVVDAQAAIVRELHPVPVGIRNFQIRDGETRAISCGTVENARSYALLVALPVGGEPPPPDTGCLAWITLRTSSQSAYHLTPDSMLIANDSATVFARLVYYGPPDAALFTPSVVLRVPRRLLGVRTVVDTVNAF